MAPVGKNPLSRSNTRQKKRNTVERRKKDEELEDQIWYHGMIPRKEVSEFLTDHGDWLVRCTERKEQVKIVISINWKREIKHIMLSRDNTGWRMQDRSFSTVVKLIKHYAESGKQLNESGLNLGGHYIERRKWYIPSKDIKLEKKIGEGNFGEVWSGLMRHKKNWIPVAVKTCKALVTVEQREEFMQEAKLMLLYRNDNVVRLYAVAPDKPPLMLVMEHCPEGGLNNYLQRNQGRLSVAHKIKFCLDAARGMEYLSVKKNCVHRDLAARNCLLGAKGEVKIADFGLTRKGVYKLPEGSHKPVPIRWTAPEAIKTSTFTKESDVWSFGIMMWEIFAEGIEPWPGKTLKEAYQAMRAGQKMETPANTPPEIEKLMHWTWELDAAKRPTMIQMRATLESIADKYPLPGQKKVTTGSTSQTS